MVDELFFIFRIPSVFAVKRPLHVLDVIFEIKHSIIPMLINRVIIVPHAFHS